MKKILITTIAALLTVSGLGMASAAADANTTGGYCVKSANGCGAAAAAGAQNDSGAASGAFGAFGNFGDVRHDLRGGADGVQTGLNNSAVAGNRQGK